jgi:hypothetical protein
MFTFSTGQKPLIPEDFVPVLEMLIYKMRLSPRSFSTNLKRKHEPLLSEVFLTGWMFNTA